MPIYKARLNRDAGGSWVASSVELPNCWSRASTREEALAKLRDEIRYRIEYCPCSGVDDEFVRVELQALPESRGDAPPIGPAQAGPASASPQGLTPRATSARPDWPAARPGAPAPLSGVAGCPPPGREPTRPVTSRPETSGQAAGASEQGRAAVPRSAGWRRWDD